MWWLDQWYAWVGNPCFEFELQLLELCDFSKTLICPFHRVWKIFKIRKNVVYQTCSTFHTLQLSCTKFFKFSSKILSNFENTKNLPNLFEFDLNYKYWKYLEFWKVFNMRLVDLWKLWNFHVHGFWTCIQNLKVISNLLFSKNCKIHFNSNLSTVAVHILKMFLHKVCSTRNFEQLLCTPQVMIRMNRSSIS